MKKWIFILLPTMGSVYNAIAQDSPLSDEGHYSVSVDAEQPVREEQEGSDNSSLVNCPIWCDPFGFELSLSETYCVGQEITFTNTSQCTNNNEPVSGLQLEWSFGDGTSPVTSTANSVIHVYLAAGQFQVTMTYDDGCSLFSATQIITIESCGEPPPCEDCIGSFAPEPGKTYLLSAWVKEENAPLSKVTYTHPAVSLSFALQSGGGSPLGPYTAKGQIIDGWQRIEEEFTVPANAWEMDLILTCSTGHCLFDDIRVFPYDGSMKSYVYDPVSLRLMAELDERNYATFYEYDEEGRLLRIKKETERGIMTIQESKSSTVKK